MSMFAERFLEPLSNESANGPIIWSWRPYNPEVEAIYASGGNTQTRSSTYANERDDRDDDDRPNEGRHH